MLYIKALHIIFIVTWFAGLFYIVRLFIYQREALEKEEPERSILVQQLGVMARRLWYIITWPSAVLTLVFGLWVLWQNSFHLEFTYMWIKLGLVLILYIYQFVSHGLFIKLQKGVPVWTSQKLRLWNEVATLLLIGIVFLIVVKNSLSLAYGLGGLALLLVIFMIVIRVYKKRRKS